MGLFVPEWLDRVSLEKMGQLFQKLKIDNEIASDDNACYCYPVSGKPSFCKAWVLKHLHV
jgi:hypothetical protein